MAMEFDPCECPECGGKPTGVSETVPCVALLDVDEDGTAEYSGESRMGWDGQTTDIHDGGLVELWCGCGKSWLATLTDDEE